ncbi:hypothetical protein HAZT_HAZT002624 [Hyalella azteca]|uniref:C2 domain-containing protein n=1 Tax=Hyalella azteca TaxID=294128 RepID=A0A6A0H013_HYAAZ|nr:hypothetical protein HAZT_HAZT002624 [Hyalella azteca]
MLGPCQVLPRGYREVYTDDISPGEILLELSLTKLHLEVIIGSARGLPLAESGRPPDTYVKTYLKSRESKFNKRKTKVIQSSTKPVYHQTVRYLPSDALGKILLVMVWEKSKYFAHNKCIGSAEINLGDLYFGLALFNAMIV